MWLDPLFSSDVLQDAVAMLLTFGVSLAWLRLMDGLAHRGMIEARLSRKVIHIGTGPLFVLCWNLFSSSPTARLWAAAVPLAITLQFIAVGLGWMKDEAAVKAMTRHGNPREILFGPLFYGLVFVACTLAFWKTSAVGIIGLMILCGGDGLADIVGRRWGRARLPWNSTKSWLGSAAMFLGGFVFALAFVAAFNALEVLEPALEMTSATGKIALISLAAAIVESLPLSDVDNLTITGTAIALGGILF
ncbi:MAG TPA: phosphatidate cytidylyltransferase [Anaerolineales bacterium]|nr:phosphatidate cytidylyltransferase [Anaerolineales bacterium]